MTPFITAKIETLIPRIITRREIIKGVPARWASSYGDDTKPLSRGQLAGDIRRGLEALDLEDATTADIAAVIGNDSWTRLECKICEMDRDEVVSVPREYDGPIAVCRQCADGISGMFASASA